MTAQQQRHHRRDTDWLVEADPQRQTAASGLATPDITRQATQTISTMFLSEVDNLRYRTRVVTSQADDLLQTVYMRDWRLRAQERAELSVKTLLDQLADLGFAWRDLARLVGVSVPAIQKWRKGGSTMPENRQRLAQLLAACDLIIQHRSTADIGQWFEMPLLQEVPVTPIDLWAEGQYTLVFEHALEHRESEYILSRFQPDWRERYASDFETFVAGDGQLSIRMRER